MGLQESPDGTHRPWTLDVSWYNTAQKIEAIPALDREKQEEVLELRTAFVTRLSNNPAGGSGASGQTEFHQGDLPDGRLMSAQSVYTVHGDDDEGSQASLAAGTKRAAAYLANAYGFPQGEGFLALAIAYEAMVSGERAKTRQFYSTQLDALLAEFGDSEDKADKDAILDAQASLCVCTLAEAGIAINGWQSDFSEHLKSTEKRALSLPGEGEADRYDMRNLRGAIKDAEVACLVSMGGEQFDVECGGAKCETCESGDRCTDHWWRGLDTPGMKRYLSNRGTGGSSEAEQSRKRSAEEDGEPSKRRHLAPPDAGDVSPAGSFGMSQLDIGGRSFS